MLTNKDVLAVFLYIIYYLYIGVTVIGTMIVFWNSINIIYLMNWNFYDGRNIICYWHHSYILFLKSNVQIKHVLPERSSVWSIFPFLIRFANAIAPLEPM